ncbi:hypothetical protein [Asticcacaulis sp. AND118]|uniref:hypothetical protein n=1 Tax=Asticcacaulis sp. AND118 TaxID=2840468 RepID=UPI001CFFE6AB|nr:hypothetical protein [Asticcacaulis sp. AND118]UDF03360.1 hypothetical protein LH365_13105 [Asticcacaulis sp. AND118]
MRTLRDDVTLITLKDIRETRQNTDDRKLSLGGRVGVILTVGCLGWGLVAAIVFAISALIGG